MNENNMEDNQKKTIPNEDEKNSNKEVEIYNLRVESQNDNIINNINPNENKVIALADKKKEHQIDNNKNIYNVENNNNVQNIEFSSKAEISIEYNIFPYCLVWTPLPILTLIFPSFGHSGIGDSNGMVHDFTESYIIRFHDFVFGKPTKYFKLELTDEEIKNFDKAIEKGNNKFVDEEYSLFTNNCHSYIAYILNELNYQGKNDYNIFSIWWMFVRKGKYVSCCGFLRTYIGFLAIILIIAVIIVLIFVFRKK
jgi:hypothetical protein